MKQRGMLALLLFLLVRLFGPLTVPVETSGQSPPQAPNPLVEQLKSHDARFRAEAAREIGKRADASAVPALAAALRDPSVNVRREVVIALSRIHRSEALDALLTATRDTDPGIRVTAVEGVGGFYTGQPPSAGFSVLVKKEWRRAKSRSVMDTTQIDPGVKVDPKAVSALVEMMKETRSMQAARKAAKGLGILAAQAAVADLVKAAHASDEDLAREALNALSKIKDRSAGPPLIDLLDSPNPDVKQSAAVTLGILRTRDALPKLQAMFENNPDRRTREKALEGLANLGDPVSVPLFIKALWNQDKEWRTFAAEGLARAAEAKTLPELQKAVTVEKDANARLAVRYAITALGKEDYLSVIVAELGSTFRGEIARAYLVELSRDPKFLPKLYPYLKSQNATVRRRLCTVLMFTGEGSSLEHLERLSHDPNSEVASQALRAQQAIRARLPAPAAPPASGAVR